MIIVVHREGPRHLDITIVHALDLVPESAGEAEGETATTNPLPIRRLLEAQDTIVVLEVMMVHAEDTRSSVAVETVSVEIETADEVADLWMDGSS